MKNSRRITRSVTSLATVVVIFFTAATARAFGPGAAGNGGGVNGATSGGTSLGGTTAAGGAHSGAGAAAGSHSGSAAPAARSGVAYSNNGLRPANGSLGQSIGNRFVASPGYGMITQTNSSAAQRGQNTWSGTAVEPSISTGERSVSSAGYTNNRFAGRLTPAWYNGSGTGSNNRGGGRNGRYRYSNRYGYYPYGYGAAYAPYITYDGGYGGAYPYYADSDNGVGTDVTANGSATVTPQYPSQGQPANNDPQNPVVGNGTQNRSPRDGAQPTVPTNGPDSLVEAVQEELIRRGYFAGKVDAMYGPDTKDALRKFQQDHHLADSGLINEATLHALQLD